MNSRCLAPLFMAIAVVFLVPTGLAGQTQAAAGSWTLSHTPWGDPDLQGAWSFATITPLQRPSEYAGRERLTDAEVVALNQDALTRADRPPPPGEVLAPVAVDRSA